MGRGEGGCVYMYWLCVVISFLCYLVLVSVWIIFCGLISRVFKEKYKGGGGGFVGVILECFSGINLIGLRCK